MELHEVIEVLEKPHFRKMRVESGWLYNFYDTVMNTYQLNWIFVPSPDYEERQVDGKPLEYDVLEYDVLAGR